MKTWAESSANRAKAWTLLRAFGCSAGYTAGDEGGFYVMVDESALASDDLAIDELVNVTRFSSAIERHEFLHDSGWIGSAPSET